MVSLRPVTNLDEQVRHKATLAIRRLERLLEEPQSIFVWNNVFFRDRHGCYYATLHDYLDLQPDCFRTPGSFRVSLYWIGERIGAQSDIHCEAGYTIGIIDNEGRQWIVKSKAANGFPYSMLEPLSLSERTS